MKFFCLTAMVAMAAVLAAGQAAAAEEPATVYVQVKPLTKYEAFVAKEGTVQVKQIFQVRAPEMRAGHLALDLIRVQEPLTGHGVMALRVVLGETGEAHPGGPRYLDEDEVEVLARALDYMQKNRAAIVAGAGSPSYTEVTYRGRGEVEAGLMIKDQTVSAFVRVAGETGKVGDLDGLARAIGEVQAKIAELKK